MAFSHDMFTFLIVCFIIPQLIIVQAQNENREGNRQEGNRRERNRPEGNKCVDDRDCLNGQICDEEDRRCYEDLNVKFKGTCKRNAGKFLLFFL